MLNYLVILVLLIIILKIWQSRIDKAQAEKTIEELREATDLGKNKAIAQYPQINPALCIGCGSCIKACPEDGVIGLVNGIAHVINGSRCVGHAQCEEACPVAAIKVGLGDLRFRPDVPILSEEYETSVPGVYIIGELGGLALIRHAINQGAKAVDVIAKKSADTTGRNEPGVLDLLIVGAGPGGLSASFTALERKLNFGTICSDDVGGTVRKYPRGKLTLVQSVTIPLHGPLKSGEYSKEMIVKIWDDVLKKHPIPIKTGATLQGLVKKDAHFEAQTNLGMLKARNVVLALGRRGIPRKLGVPGENLEKVLYQLIEAHMYNNNHILVVGGGDSAIEAATGLANQAGNTVTLSYRKESFFRLKPRNEDRIKEYAAKGRVKVIFSSTPESIEPDSAKLTVASKSGEQHIKIQNDFVFVFAGGDPPYPMLKQIGIKFGGEDKPE